MGGKRVRPWLRLDANFDRDGKVRKAGATALWPLALCRLKPGNGRCSVEDLDPELLAQDLYLPVELVEKMVEGLFRVGLLVLDGDEVYTPGWAQYQEVDTRPHSSKRKRAVEPIPTGSQKLPPAPSPPASPKDGTGQDRTGHGSDAVDDRQLVGAGDAASQEVVVEQRSTSRRPATATLDHRVRDAWVEGNGPQTDHAMRALIGMQKHYGVEMLVDALVVGSDHDTKGGLNLAYLRAILTRLSTAEPEVRRNEVRAKLEAQAAERYPELKNDPQAMRTYLERCYPAVLQQEGATG